MREKSTMDKSAGLYVVKVPRHSFTEIFITIPAINNEDPIQVFQRLDDYLRDNSEVKMVRKDIFGLRNVWGQGPRPQDYCSNGVEWPVTWLEEGGCSGSPVAGIHVHAVEGVVVKPIRMDGRVVGTIFENTYAQYCLLGDIRPEDTSLPRTKQAEQTFDKIEAALRLADMDFSHVVRTWFYNDDILAWYGDFNKIRDSVFRKRNVFEGLVPASTGVGGGNAAKTALISALVALKPKNDQVRAFAVPSPLQCPALGYGSSFSRAVEVDMPDHRRLYVSGTASIAPEGHTTFVGDVAAQIKLSMEIVEAILESRSISWADVVRGIAYFRSAEDAPAYAEYCRENELPDMPVIVAQNVLCRDDLLFEIEVDVIQTK